MYVFFVMENTLKYLPPISKYHRKISLDDWFESTKYYDQGNYYKSLIHLLRYINGPVPIPDTPSISLKIPHGSVYVNIQADAEKFKVSVPFLKFIPGSVKVAAMRQMIEQNFSTLILGQIVLKGEELWYEYEDKTSNCEPYKIYYMLDELCTQADNNDDYYIDRFKLDHVEKPVLDQFTPTEYSKAESEFKEIISEGLKYADYFEKNRWYNLTCDVLAITFFRLRHVTFPQGLLARELQDALSGMYANDSVNNIILAARENMAKFSGYDSVKFKESLFHPQFFMPIKPRAEIPRLQELFENTFNNTTAWMSSRSYIDTAVLLTYEFYNAMDLYFLTPDVMTAIENTLSKASGKDWKSASEILYRLIQKIMEIELDQEGNMVKGSLAEFQSNAGGTEIKSAAASSAKSIFSKISSLFKG